MAIDHVENGDTGATARGIINAIIDEVNVKMPTSLQKAGMNAASSPSAFNPFATIADLGAIIKKYRAIISQDGSDDPVVTVLENTIGNITWTRLESGTYLGDCDIGVFTVNKTFLPKGNGILVQGVEYLDINTHWNTDTQIQIATYGISESPEDGLLQSYSLEMLVYP